MAQKEKWYVRLRDGRRIVFYTVIGLTHEQAISHQGIMAAEVERVRCEGVVAA